MLRQFESALPAREVADPLEWMSDALCAQTDIEAFIPKGKGGSSRRAKRICGECLARGACLEYALETDQRIGIWGGLTTNERDALKKQR